MNLPDNPSESFKKRNPHLYDNSGNTQRQNASLFQELKANNPTAAQRSKALSSLRIKENLKADVDNEFRLQSMDEGLHGQFKVTVVIKISDNRGRDLDGSLATIMDCLRDAAREIAAISPKHAHWINQHVPLDDSWQYVPELIVRAERCEKGMEGASVLIERL